MTDYVTLGDGRLWTAEGKPFRFVGTNCYFLAEEGAREVLGWEGYAGRVDEALRKTAALGSRVVRAWAFNDDPQNPAAIQRAPLEYNEAGLRGVDLALATARRYRQRLILSLGNFWSDYGGVAQYLRWHGLDPAEPWRFFTDRAVVEHYGDHLEALLGRVNPLTSLSWGEDPTVLAWELLNEPRGTGLDPEGDSMAAWVTAMAARVRAAAPRHLVSTGEEGGGLDDASRAATGMDFRRNSAAVDIASVHLYPESWRWSSGSFETAGVAWIEDHAGAAAEVARPLVLGEFGLGNHGGLPLRGRRRLYERWLEAARRQASVAGALSWSFSTDDRPDDWDEFTWRWRDGTEPGARENRYADLHREWAARFDEPLGGAP